MVPSKPETWEIEPIWNTISISSRLNCALACGWAPRTAKRIVAHDWEMLSPAARRVIARALKNEVD